MTSARAFVETSTATLAGHVVALSIHPPHSLPEDVQAVSAIAHRGLQGDRHACNTSPRQVLLASSNVYAALELSPMTLRENVLVDFDMSDLRSGDVLRVGPQVAFVAMFVCEPCRKLESRRSGLSSRIGHERGMLARVVGTGTMRCGDPVRIIRAVQPLWSNDWRARVAQVLRLVPSARWLTFGQLAELAGVAPGYCRAFPRLLSTLPASLSERASSASSIRERGTPWDGRGLHERILSDDGGVSWN